MARRTRNESLLSLPPLPGTPGRGAGGEGDGLHCAARRYTHTPPLTPTPLPRVRGRGASPTDSAWKGRRREPAVFRPLRRSPASPCRLAFCLLFGGDPGISHDTR